MRLTPLWKEWVGAECEISPELADQIENSYG